MAFPTAPRRFACVAMFGAAVVGCRPTSPAQLEALEIEPAIRVSGPGDDVEAALPPSLAVGPLGMLVAWEDEHREGAAGDRIVVRKLSPTGEPMGKPVELGPGIGPTVAALDDRFVVAWEHPVDGEDPVIGFAVVPQAANTAAGPVTVLDGVSFSGPLQVGAFEGTVVAAACSAGTRNEMLVVHDLLGAHTIERIPTAHACDGVALALNTAPRVVAVVQTVHPPFSEVIAADDAARSFRSISTAEQWCEAPVATDGQIVSACNVGQGNQKALHLRTGERDLSPVIADGPLRGYSAVPLSQGLVIAWAIETSDGFDLRATFVGADGQATTRPLPLLPRIKTSNFDLEGVGMTAWLAYTTERQVDQENYQKDVVVVTLALTSKSRR